MPLYIEYDKTDRTIKRILTADNLPQNIAYLGYQEIPANVKIDLSEKIEDVMQKIIEIKSENKEDKEKPTIEIMEL